MRTTAADRIPAPGTWKLAAIEPQAGECSCCTRRISQRVFRVVHPEHGEMWLGRRCAAVATGYDGKLEQALRMAYRSEEIDGRRATLAARFPWLAGNADAIDAGIRAEREQYGTLYPPPRREHGDVDAFHVYGEALHADHMWSQRGPDGEPTGWLVEYLEHHGCAR